VILAFLRRMPRLAQFAIVAVPLLVLLGAFLLVRREAPARVAARPSPSSCAATTCATPSPSPSPSESPSPTPPPPQLPSPAAPPPPPPPPIPCNAGGGEPGGNIGANFPVALAFAPDGRLFWAERSGTIKVWQRGGAQVFASVATSISGERGLLGLAISPTFASDRHVYAMYSETDGVHQTVVRWTDCHGQGGNRTTIVANLPAGNDCCHKGGRIAFGPDGYLYVTVGDNHVAPAAQDACDLRGKVLRYRPDGGVPAGNLCGPVFARGLRNPFGLAFSPAGQLFVTNNGPTGDAGSPPTGYDTVYYVNAGGNYSWPTCYGYNHLVAPATACPGAGPLWSSEATTVVPTGASFVSPAGPAGYAGHFVFCTFNAGLRIYQGPGTVSPGPAQCRLDVKESPGHVLFYSDTTTIYRH
jgi:glucose/arabinose dehydrogenase